MTKFQKVIYKTAKLICKGQTKERIVSCCKARLKSSKKRKESYEEVLGDYKFQKWFTLHDLQWNEEKSHAEWIDKSTGKIITQEDIASFWGD